MSGAVCDPVFWVVATPLAVLFVLSILRIAHPFWADRSRK